MLNALMSIGIFGLVIIAIILLIIVRSLYRTFLRVREEVEENLERQRKKNEKKEKNPFGDEYFKSADNNQRKGTQHQQSRNATGQKDPQQEKQRTARRTTTSSGVTIIDGRAPEENRKIFADHEGEYTDFEEVSD